jgi:hypothetical protein
VRKGEQSEDGAGRDEVRLHGSSGESFLSDWRSS